MRTKENWFIFSASRCRIIDVCVSATHGKFQSRWCRRLSVTGIRGPHTICRLETTVRQIRLLLSDSQHRMRPISTDGVALSVCLSVCVLGTSVSTAKTAEPFVSRFDGRAPKHVLDEGSSPHRKGHFWGGHVLDAPRIRESFILAPAGRNQYHRERALRSNYAACHCH